MNASKHVLTLPALVVLTAAFAAAQDDGTQQKARFEELRSEKLAKEVFKKAPWIIDDYEKALQQAKETGKPIFAYFTRSYAT